MTIAPAATLLSGKHLPAHRLRSLTTPEKFDSATRRNKDRGGMSFFADISLFMIDEARAAISLASLAQPPELVSSLSCFFCCGCS